jgi:anthranilate phosphoribosyltransferase
MSTETLEQLIQGVRLNRAQAATFMTAVLDEKVSNEIVAAAVAIMRSRSETTDEILGFRDAMMARAIRLPIELPVIMDVCGTGGDRLGTFNVSTAVAIVLAACGVPVAKHGNRSVSSKCGSSDVLEAAGVPIHLDVDTQCRALESLNLALLHAPNHHPALKVLAPVRRSLGVMTVFNLMGPLVNPANITHQLVGVPHLDSQDKFGAVYSERKLPALIVRSQNGADEALPGVPMRMVEVDASGAREAGIHDPADWGVPPAPMEELAGGDPARNAAALWEVLQGKGPTGLSAAAALGAGLALWKCGQEPDPAAGYARASQVLAAGEPARTLRAYIDLMGGSP